MTPSLEEPLSGGSFSFLPAGYLTHGCVNVIMAKSVVQEETAMDMEPNMQPRPNGGYQQQTSAPQPENPQQGWSQPPIRNRQTGAPQGWTPRPENPQQGWSQPPMGTGRPAGRRTGRRGRKIHSRAGPSHPWGTGRPARRRAGRRGRKTHSRAGPSRSWGTGRPARRRAGHRGWKTRSKTGRSREHCRNSICLKNSVNSAAAEFPQMP